MSVAGSGLGIQSRIVAGGGFGRSRLVGQRIRPIAPAINRQAVTCNLLFQVKQKVVLAVSWS